MFARYVRVALFAALALGSSACYQTLNMARLRPAECVQTCREWGMELGAMVASPGNDACVCLVPGAQGAAMVPASAAAASIVDEDASATQQSQQNQPSQPGRIGR